MARFKQLLARLGWTQVLLIVGAAMAFFFYMLDPSEIETRVQGIATSKTAIEGLKRKIQEAKDFEIQFEDKKRRYGELVKELQKIQGALPKQFFLPDLLTDLLREAKQLELEINSIKPDAAETEGDLYNSLGFNIEVSGTFLQFFIYLDRMANMKRLVSVENFLAEKDANKYITLGGREGAFARTNLTGGKTAYPAIKGTLRVITYRYRGANTPSATPPGAPAPAAAGAKK